MIDEVDKACREKTVYMIGPEKAARLAELVRKKKPKLIVECGTALGYSGLWMARELKAIGKGKLITIEINPGRAREAQNNFRRAGLAEVVEVKVGDARKITGQLKGPVDFLFIDCNFGNYHPCFIGIEDELEEGAVIVADNAGVGAAGMADYLKLVRSRYKSRIEWFDLDLPWAKRDAMEITIFRRPSVKSNPDVIVYRGSYPGWPWIAAEEQGRLICVFREGTVHGYSATGRVMFTTSTDRGKTWAVPAVVVDAQRIDDRNAAVAVLPNGEWLVSYNEYTADKQSQAMTVRSADGGKSWSAPQPLDHPNTRTRAAAVALSKKDLVLPYYIAPGNGALAAISHDLGRTWKTVRVPDAEGFIGDEWDLVEVESGRLIGIFRNSHPRRQGFFWKSESRDGGRTWSVPKPTNVQSRRAPSPAQITMHGTAPTLVFADRRMVSVSAMTTNDPDFLRWDLDNRLECYRYHADETPIADASYPVSVPIGGRERLIVDYEIRPKSKHIAGYFVTFPDDWGRR